MTAALIVTTAGRQTGKAIIEKSNFVIGRSSRCDLVLDDKNVSREHVVIVQKEDRYEILDRGSRNGSSLNGTPVVKQLALKDGDRIQIGPYELQFLLAGRASPAGDADRSRTRFMPAGGVSGKDKEAGRRKKRAEAGFIFKLVATEGPLKGDFWTNWEGDLTIGRSPENHVVLQEDVVSTAHAKIRQDDGLFFIDDLGSSNGTFVQGTRVRTARLKNRQHIRIGASTFVFTVLDPEKRKFVLTLAAVSLLFVAVLLAVVVLLTPEDQAGPLVEQGYQYGKAGEFGKAKELFERALIMKPGDPKATKLLRDIDACIQRDALLQKAREAAESEQFDSALEMCAKILVKSPTFKKAKDLESIIGKVRDSQTAFEARNWADSVKLLAKAMESYPDSGLLVRRLEMSQAEMVARENLAKAKEFLARAQADNSQELLITIPATSVYYPEAREMLQGMKSADVVATTIKEAQSAYRRGNVGEARILIKKGLKLSPSNIELKGLERHIGDVDSAIKGIEGGKVLLNSEDVGAIREMIDTCRKLTTLEPDAQNYYKQESEQLRSQLERTLGEIEHVALAKAEALMKEGSKREACKYYQQAILANPGNQSVRAKMDSIGTEISADCQKIFREGLVYEETGQQDLAIAAYEKVLRIAVDGDKYSERAREKLRQMKR